MGRGGALESVGFFFSRQTPRRHPVKESPNKRGDKGLDPGATAPPLVIERPTQVPRYQEGGKIVYCKRKGNIRVDVRAKGRAKRSAPRKAAACAPGGT